MPPEQAAIRQWLVKAQHDRDAARRLLTPGCQELDVIAFHAQQAVEKILKAFLTSVGTPFERTHDLGLLLDQCAAADPEMESLRRDVRPLTLYAVAFRYPGLGEPERGDVEQALIVVERVWTFVTKRLPAEAVP